MNFPIIGTSLVFLDPTFCLVKQSLDTEYVYQGPASTTSTTSSTDNTAEEWQVIEGKTTCNYIYVSCHSNR